MELGIYSFVETSPDPATGATLSARDRLDNLIAEITLADEVGLDVFGVGEHHRSDYVSSAPAVVLAAAAARTKRIRLTSAVSVLSSDDPVRVFQQFATLDLLSHGRAEIMAGRGSFVESFPLFGYNLGDYNELFQEKLELLLKLREDEEVSWSGQHRAPLDRQRVFPRPIQVPIPVWIAVGGTPESVVRAARLGLPLAIAIIGGPPDRFVPLVDLYRRTLVEAGHDPGVGRVSINGHGFLAADGELAAETAYPYFAEVMTRIGRERGWPPMTRTRFDADRSSRGSLLVGDPEQIAERIVRMHEMFGNDRFLIQLTVGTIPHPEVMKAIELLGTRVAPIVRDHVDAN